MMTFNRLFLLAFILQTLSFYTSKSYMQRHKEGTGMVKVDTVVGLLANLPCNITPPVSGDRVLVVFWFKDREGKPIYTFDLRIERGLGEIWANEQVRKASLNVESKPAFLTLMGVDENDGGLYYCRVDFKKSPTRFSSVKLEVTVPPKEIVILDEKGSEVETTVGPYQEGSTLVLSCDILGGWPSSSVTWYKDGSILDSSWATQSQIPVKTRNTVTVERLSRDDQNSRLECRGNNNNHTKDISKSVNLVLNLVPLDVRIHGLEPEILLSEGREYRLECESSGSSPPALIIWTDSRGNKLPSSQVVEVRPEGNYSVSSYFYTPTRQDDGKTVTCKAQHPVVEGSIRTTRNISVAYPPEVELEFGASQQSAQVKEIKEGDDVYFTCRVKAKPKVSQIIWHFNGRPLLEALKGQLDGLQMANNDLIIRKINTTFQGNYSCEATNTEGTSISNSIPISILYQPRCVGEGAYYKLSRGEEVKISCPVQSNPPHTHIQWTFNSSVSNAHPMRGEKDGGLTYKPISDQDYGSILCWGVNRLGDQRDPCVIHIFPAEKPEPPSNCSVFNLTTTTAKVLCLPGHDGGATQQFVLQIRYQDFSPSNSRVIDTKINKEYPEFNLSRLPPATHLNLVVYSSNEKGKSRAEEMSVFTQSPDTQKHVSDMQEGPVPPKVTPLVWVFIATMSILILVTVVLGAIFRLSNIIPRREKGTRTASRVEGVERGPKEDHSVVGIEENGRIVQKGHPQEEDREVDQRDQQDNIQHIPTNNPDIIPNTELTKGGEDNRRNSHNSFNHNHAGPVFRDGNPIPTSQYCTLPKNRQNTSFQYHHTTKYQPCPTGLSLTLQRDYSRQNGSGNVGRTSSLKRSLRRSSAGNCGTGSVSLDAGRDQVGEGCSRHHNLMDLMLGSKGGHMPIKEEESSEEDLTAEGRYQRLETKAVVGFSDLLPASNGSAANKMTGSVSGSSSSNNNMMTMVTPTNSFTVGSSPGSMTASSCLGEEESLEGSTSLTCVVVGGDGMANGVQVPGGQRVSHPAEVEGVPPPPTEFADSPMNETTSFVQVGQRDGVPTTGTDYNVITRF